MAGRTEQVAAALLLAVAAVPVLAADSGTTASRVSGIAELDAICREAVERPRRELVRMPRLTSPACSERLGRHFASVPIWDGATLLHAVSRKASGRKTAINDRADHLGYTSADRLQGSAPTWGDIFDVGGADGRMHAVSMVFDDPVCVALNDAGGIQVELNERCKARELFRYAAQTDACATQIPLVMRHAPMMMQDGSSLYESMYKSLRDGAEEASDGLRVAGDELGDWDLLLGVEEEPASGGGSSLAESVLLATWLAEKCPSSGIVPFGNEQARGPMPGRITNPGEILDMMKPGHDAALSIAARAGDPWAVQAFYVEGLADDIEYWRSLRGFNPLLLHRWMATDVGASMDLDLPNRALHALMAFVIERRTEPDLELDRYLGLYGLSREFIHSPSRYGSALPDASAIEERLRYPWDRSR